MNKIILKDGTTFECYFAWGALLYFDKYTLEELKEAFTVENSERIRFANGYDCVYFDKENMKCTCVKKVTSGIYKDKILVCVREKFPNEMNK